MDGTWRHREYHPWLLAMIRIGSSATLLPLVALLFAACGCKKLLEIGAWGEAEPSNPSATSSGATGGAPKASNPETPCWMLTPAEIASVIKIQTIAVKLPKAGEYGAPRCQWTPLADASNAPSIVIAYFGDQGREVDKYFEDHVEIDRKMFKAFHEPVTGLGDKAVLFGARMWVKKSDAFFSLTVSGIDWSTVQLTPRDAQMKLAKLAVAHMR
jgi:hypothetical protein